MRRNGVILLLLLLLTMASCGTSGGVPIPAGDPLGHWTVDIGGAFDVVQAASGQFQVDIAGASSPPLQLEIDGNAVAITGSVTDLQGIERTDFNVTATLNEDSMAGTWSVTITNLQTGRVRHESDPFVATRSP